LSDKKDRLNGTAIVQIIENSQLVNDQQKAVLDGLCQYYETGSPQAWDDYDIK
jgi:hypothetical protein